MRVSVGREEHKKAARFVSSRRGRTLGRCIDSLKIRTNAREPFGSRKNLDGAPGDGSMNKKEEDPEQELSEA